MYALLGNLIVINCVVIARQWKWLKYLFKKYIKPFLTWRILVIYLPIWFLATGWAWLFSAIGKGWLQGVAAGWLVFSWTPFCPEKIVTIPLTIWLHTKIFPNHSVASLNEVLEREKQDFNSKNKKYKKQKRSSKNEN